MATWALAATVVLYLITALGLFLEHKSWMAVCFLAYAVANVALIGAARQ